MTNPVDAARSSSEIGRPLILGHRGASHAAPENTIAAFALATTMGADGIELDVHRTSDGVLVVHHDAELNGIGTVMEHRFDALRVARPDVPTLAESLDACAGLKLINIEMKCCAWDADADPDRIVARGVAAMISERDVFDRVSVSSFDLAMLDDFHALDTRIATGWLIHGHDPVPAVMIAAEHGHGWLHPDWGNLQLKLSETIEAARAAGIKLNTWTLDDPIVIREFAAAGVDGVITNTPDIALAALGRSPS